MLGINRSMVPASIGLLLLLSAGCIGIEGTSVDPNSYLVFENGSVKTLRAVRIWSRLEFPPLPAPSKSTLALVDRVPGKRGALSAGSIVSQTPPWRRLSAIAPGFYFVAEATAGFLPDTPTATPCWIIANYPAVVVGLGEAPAGEAVGLAGRSMVPDLSRHGTLEMGADLRLITPQDLDQRVSELAILDRWPSDTVLEAEGEYPPVNARTVKLEQPLTLRQLLADHRWEPGPK
jgi:hypothetical protein